MGLTACAALVLGLLTLFTRTPLCKVWLLPTIGNAMGVKVEARSATILGSGTVVLEDVVFSLPGLPGPAGRFLSADRLEVDPDFSRRGLPVSRMRLDGAVFRVSQATDSELVNLQLWDLPGGSSARSSSSPAAPPRVDLRSAAIEFGEHGPGVGTDGYRTLKRIVVRGSVVPTNERNGSWAIDLHEADPRDPRRALEGGIAVAGRIDDAGVHLAMTQASLTDWPASAVPSRHRRVFEMLALEGEITRTFLELPWDGQVAAGIVLRDVSMTLPFEQNDHGALPPASPAGQAAPAEPPSPSATPATEPPEGIRLTRSGGTIAFIGSGLRATLDGWIEDLPYTVTLDYQGLAATSPFRCELSTTGFHLSEQPRLLPFLPRDVFERLADFRNPTGLVDAQVVIERAPQLPDGAEGDTSFSGAIQVREGATAFNAFPYPFENMQASVTFDDEAVRLERISGVSASGARLVASGLVTPLGDEAEVTVRVTVTGAPADQRMLEAMGPVQGPILEAVFSQPRFAELEAAGLVLSPQRRDALLGEREALQRRLAELSTVAGADARAEARRVRAQAAAADRALRAPTFSPGGLADVTVVVHRARGLVSKWTTNIDIQFARVGILPAHFPVPIEATGVHIVVSDRNLHLERGQFSPLSGGTAAVTLDALLPGRNPGESGFDPRVHIAARAVPVDRFVLHAAAHAGDPAPGAPPPEWHASLAQADLVGTIDAEIDVLRRSTGELGFDAIATLASVRAAPPEKPDIPGTVALQASAGRLIASEDALDFAFRAEVITREGQGAVSRAAGDFDITGRLALRPDPDGLKTFLVSAQGQSVLTDAPLERIVGLIAPGAELALAQLRDRYSPTGAVHGVVEVRGSLGDPELQLGIELHRTDALELDLQPGRVGISDATGTLRIALPTPSRPGSLAADAFAANLTLDGHPEGRVLLDGTAQLLSGAPSADPDSQVPPASPDAPAPALTDTDTPFRTGALDIRLSLNHARLESPITRAAIDAFLPDRGRDVLALDPAGLFDLDLSIARPSETAAATFDGALRPHSLSLTISEQRLDFHDVQGLIRFDARGGQAEAVRASAADWNIAGDAAWSRSPDDQLILDATLAADSAGLSPSLRALLPATLRAALDQIELASHGPLSLTDGVLHAAFPGDGAEPAIHATGAVRATNLHASVGLPIQEARGTLWFETDTRPGSPPSYTLSIAADSVRAGGLLLNNAKARITSGQREGEVLVPLIEAGTYGGRLAGTGRLTRARRDSPTLTYDLALQLSGVRFASLLEDRARDPLSAQSTAAPVPEAPPPATESADASRGLLAAEISLGGTVGRDSLRRGRGSVQVGGGPVVSLPLLMPVIEVTNLRLPANTPLDVAFAEFYVQGDTVTFAELSAFTPSVEIWGYGTLDWADKRLDMRFNTRSTSPIPVVSELLESLRNELVSTKVGGTIDDPNVRTIQFQGTRRVIDTLLGDGPDEQQRRLAEIGDRARLNRSRALRAGERLRWLVASQVEGEAPKPQ